MENIKFYFTDDNSIGLYNSEVCDVYHSKFGAKSEAYDKFINPSGFFELLKTKDKIEILDICYGIGYNTKCSIELMLKENPDIELLIDAIEFDSQLARLSPFLNNSDFEVNKIIYNALKCPKLKEDKELLPFLSEDMINKNKDIFKKNVKLEFYFDDARVVLPKLKKKYDIIYLDAFTPLKCPELWSYDFFLKLKSLIKDSGILLTYSNSAHIRHAMSDCGFFVGKNPSGEKSQGSIASLNKDKIKNPLNDFEFGLMNTKAGIYFRDKNLNLSKDEMIKNRELEIQNSTLLGSSAYKKQFKI